MSIIVYRNIYIVSTIIAILALVGFFTLVGLDLFQSYEKTGMFAAYISLVISGGLATIISVITGLIYNHRRKISQYETI